MIQSTPIAAITDLRKEFVSRGWYRKATGRILLELLVHISLSLAGIVMFIACHNIALRMLAILISTYGSMGIGTNTHTSTHYGTSNKRWINEALSYFGFPFYLGVSATFWWHKHVAVHHVSPNVVGVDTDADLSPWFAITADEIQGSTGLRKFYYKYLQFWIFPFALAFTCFNMQFASFLYLGRKLFTPSQRKAAHWIDLGSLIAHYALWIGLPLMFWPLRYVVGFYILRVFLLGYSMYVVLAPGHLPAEAQRITQEASEEMDFFVIQTSGSVSFRTGFLGRLLCSGLEYQIEHHLFPNISHNYYPQVSRAVEAFCNEHNLTYQSLSWGSALWKSWQVMRLPQPVRGPMAGLEKSLGTESEQLERVR